MLADLRQELRTVGLSGLRLAFYVGDEWFSPKGTLSIAIPFYLATPELSKLERKMMRDVEGGTRDSFMKTIRHEAGHCFDHAYGLSRTREWRAIFGNPNLPYEPDNYKPRPDSKSYVTNLDDCYAQAHPIEDFAETFAVWMRGKGYWRPIYGRRPETMKKLEYIDRMVARHGEKPPKFVEFSRMCDVRRLRTTLRVHYDRRLAAEKLRVSQIRVNALAGRNY
jgi:hypothetical protein